MSNLENLTSQELLEVQGGGLLTDLLIPVTLLVWYTEKDIIEEIENAVDDLLN